jgi:hypothetical protein
MSGWRRAINDHDCRIPQGVFMSVGPVGSVPFSVPAPGTSPDPQARQEQVNAQADLLQAMTSSDLPMKMVRAGITLSLGDGTGVDLYV